MREHAVIRRAALLLAAGLQWSFGPALAAEPATGASAVQPAPAEHQRPRPQVRAERKLHGLPGRPGGIPIEFEFPRVDALPIFCACIAPLNVG